MPLNEYGELLYLLEIITIIAIPILLISIYKISNTNGIFFIILLFIFFILFHIKAKSKGSFKKYIVPIIFTIVAAYTEIYGSMIIDTIYEISINLCILNDLCINIIYKKHKENELNKNKFYMNKQYISRTIKEIEEETCIQNYIRDEIKTVNDKLSSIVEIINIPIIILSASNYKCIFKNKYFDELLLENNYKVEE
ncbi:hypothetical protein QX51_08095, partial [Terrisporobacter othiniensis]